MQTEDFLARVVPPGNFIALAINKEPGQQPPRFFVRMFKEPGEAASFATWATRKGFEVFQCQASYLMAQLEAGKGGHPRYVGSKEASNAARSRALYLDLDVHRQGDKKTPGVNAFASRKDAVQWLASFVAGAGIPQPSIVVDSGYGFHPYWLLDDALAPPDWLLAAHALRAAMLQHGYIGDAGITTDIARILRTPGSMNLKVPAQPQQVQVKRAGPSIANQVMLGALQPWMTMAQQAVQTGAVAKAGPAQISTLSAGGPAAAFAGTTTTVGGVANALQQNLGSWTNTHSYKMEVIARECGQVAESLRTQGNGDPYPLWYQLLTLAAFAEGGDAFAAPLSQGDPRFSQATLDFYWQRILTEKATKPKLGPPTCATLQACRPSACAACPHAGKIKSPIVLGRDDSDLPTGYRRGAHAIEMQVADDQGNTSWLPVLPGDITNFILDEGENGGLVSFHYRRGLTSKYVRYAQPDLVGTSKEKFLAFLSARSIDMPPEWGLRAKGLLVSWVNELRERERTRMFTTPAFGWVEDNGKTVGFAIAGTLYDEHGRETSTSSGDAAILRDYKQIGDLAGWQAACDFVTTGRPDLTAMVAASFGAPLMQFAGQAGCIVSAISRQSGVGKSSAIKVGQAVWGDPTKANSLHDTFNSVINRVGETRSLPAYWDELRGGGDNKKFVDLAFMLAQGREKTRLDANAKQREAGTWQTILLSASNEPLMEHVVANTQGTEAGALRVFEFHIEVPPLPIVAGASQVVASTQRHYGVVGRLYARWMAQNITMLETTIPATVHKLNVALGARTDERYYVATMACILQGAIFANANGFTRFDLRALKDFLFETFKTLRQARQREIVATGSGFDLEGIISEFMHEMSDRRLVTNIFGSGKTYVDVLAQPSNGRAAHVQIAVKDDTMRINRSAFTRYLREKNISYQSVIKALEDHWGASVRRGVIGACTPIVVGQTWVVDIPLNQNGLDVYAVVQGTDRQ